MLRGSRGVESPRCCCRSNRRCSMYTSNASLAVTCERDREREEKGERGEEGGRVKPSIGSGEAVPSPPPSPHVINSRLAVVKLFPPPHPPSLLM